jgi:cell division protein FtsB
MASQAKASGRPGRARPPSRSASRASASERKRRPRRGVLVRRWLGVGALCLVGLLYYRPLHTYVDTRHTLVERSSQVQSLRAEKRQLERKLADTASDSALVREARRLGLVKPGERLFIVKGIQAWKHAQHTIRRHER